MRAVIIDDHKELRENLRHLITSVSPDLQILGEADGVVSGLKLIKELKPELIFLDVEMGDGTGFDLLSLVDHTSVKVIFVTSHDEFAIRAFKFSAIDYVLKPVDSTDLLEAINKAKSASSSALNIDTLLANKREHQHRLVLSDQRNTYLVETNEIIRCESEANYTRFYLIGERKVIVSKTLKSYDALLQPHGFFRTHQSHLINLLFFDRYDRSDGGMIHLKNGHIVPIATRKREEMLNVLNSFLR